MGNGSEESGSAAPTLTVAFVGAGEVARIFAAGIAAHAGATGRIVRFRGFNAGRRNRPPYAADFRELNAQTGITLADTVAEAVAGADIVFSSVVADQAESTGLAIAEALGTGVVDEAGVAGSVSGASATDGASTMDGAANSGAAPLVIDLNATTPEAIRTVKAALDTAGARFVDASIMDTVPVFRMGVPLCISGDPEAIAAFTAADLGFTNVRDLQAEAGTASTAKVLRSVVMKALEASLVESFRAAEKAGILDVVADSVVATFDDMLGRTLVDDLVKSEMLHARRRAAEMEGAVSTLEDLGVSAFVSAGARDHLAHIAELMHDRTPVAPEATPAEAIRNLG
ncbi:hypothetical protein GCM10009755_11590 [Brevibacterium samyangense]|uniref:Phosphogluconate dehydrogenase NAD-binding putative C-terminal domain-containing protein n=1 Tax=Brevibacterium samyangense TaxID=366888 RepID=A0ABN2TB90_9MICO